MFRRPAIKIFGMLVVLIVGLGSGLWIWKGRVASSLEGLTLPKPHGREITLYYAAAGEEKLRSRAFQLPEHLLFTKQIKCLLEKMLSKPQDASEPTLWPFPLRFRGAYLRKNGILILDFDEGVAYNSISSTLLEARVLRSIICTLTTEFSGVHKVKFLINGGEAETLGGHVDLTHPLSAEDVSK